MKKVLVAVLTMMVSQIAFAGNLYCGSNVETSKGSGVYNKLVFWEKADTTKKVVRYLLADGTVLRSEEMTPDSLAKVIEGTVVVGYSFNQDRTQLFIGTVKRDQQNHINFTDLAMGGSSTNGMPMLMANGATLICREQ